MTHQHVAKKSLGQNFLVDKNYQNKIIAVLKKLHTKQPLLEIGPGQAALTEHVLEFCDQILLIEKDRGLASTLAERFEQQDSVSVLQSDFLKCDLNEVLPLEKSLVLGNLPYNVSSQILIECFKHSHKFTHLVFMFQKELADRILAKSGNKSFGSLAIWTQIFSKAKKCFDVPPTAFRPRPRVVSTVVEFELTGENYEEHKPFLDFTRQAFLYRRKKLSTIFKKSLKDKQIPAQGHWDKRAEQLSLNELRDLFKDLQS